MLTNILLAAYGPVCFTLGYYVAHRGISGVVSDLADVKKDVADLKDKVAPATTQAS